MMFYILLYLAKTFAHMTHCEDRVGQGWRERKREKKVEREACESQKLI